MSARPASSAALYSPELLGVAIALADYPLSKTLESRGSARSRSCGSTIELGLNIDQRGLIETVGMRVSACAVGQAAAAIFASSAAGQDRSSVMATIKQIDEWLGGDGSLPSWPDFAVLLVARAHQGRHDALRLPWQAALDAFCQAE